MVNKTVFRFVVLSLALSLGACAKKSGDSAAAPAAPVVASIVQTKTADDVPAQPAQGASNGSPAKAAVPGMPAGSLVNEVTLNRASILNRTFNYSSSLQFSSIVDGSISTAMMGLSLGEVPAKFNILNDQLQLLTDGSINFESDVNHPSRLIYTFPILRSDESTITIRVDRASPISDTFMFGNTNKVPVRYSFLRSFEYVADDELTMIESTVELTDGSVGEFMESFRPREKTVTADAKIVFNDPDLNKDAARYDFLDAGPVFVAKPGKPEVRVKTNVADHWDLRSGQPVKWYVTAKIPDADLDAVKNGVEGWNRYSRAMGKPDLIQFMGRLPDGIKVGDPRYNLIIWDTVQDAGAAYESQNADPATGIQSHSMIYIPLAWVNIGKDYWNKFSPDAQSPGELQGQAISKLLKDRSFLGRALPVNCMESAEAHLSLESKENPDQFAQGLLRGVVFHEVGHSFGLAHDFKGSLSYDSDDLTKMFTTSIMDYNDYNEEEAAFAGPKTSDGPLLEYDRQIISYLYNDAKDVKDSDPVLPACADDVADSLDKGVDPLCVRYDIGADVTKEALKALAVFSTAGSKRGVMQAISPKQVTDSLIGMPAADKVKTQDDLVAALGKAQAQVAGTVGIYISASANSFGYLGSSAVKSLKVFQKDVLPDGYTENDMRDRALQALEAAANMDEFPDLTKTAVAAAKPALVTYFQSTALVQGLPRDGQDKVMTVVAKLIDKLVLADVQTAILSKMRTRFITAIASTPTAPLGFLQRNGKAVDLEPIVMAALEKMSSEKSGDVNRPMAERLAALNSLKTYKRSENYDNVAQRVIAALKLEIANSTD
ncbi:MAG: zinc-dependent metalloprotease, partial [Bdellovibrionota bacterium]